MTDVAPVTARRQARARWLLLVPALTVLVLAASGPLLIVLIYSFLTPGDYGGVIWEPSTQGWFSVVFERDFFTEELSLADAHLSIFWRSVKLSLMTAALAFIFGFPTAYFIATRPKEKRDLWMLLIIIPFWTNLLIRTFAIAELIRNEGTVNTLLITLGVVDEPIQMLFTEFAILLGMAYVYLPLMVLPIYASLERLDFSLVEAGYDLYATRWRVLRKVIFPLAKPGVIAGSILVFVPSLG
ncbi:ABC transporter permease, partial [Cribrihabitans sp. XS_ASV171]